MIVELRAVPDCPNLNATRDLLHACFAEAGFPVEVVERIGEYPSPSILIDGRDVTGVDPLGAAGCVVRPPTAEQIRAALRTAATMGAGPAGAECCPPGGAIRTDRPQQAAALPAAHPRRAPVRAAALRRHRNGAHAG